MSAIIAKALKSTEPIEAGSYIARCYRMIHIGTAVTPFANEDGTPKKINKVLIGFELPTETKVFNEEKGLQPCVISKEYTLSLHEKSKIRPLIESWRGKKFDDAEIETFDWTKLVGVPCMLSIVHNDKGYAEIAGISKLPKGTECPPQVNASQIVDWETVKLDIIALLPKFIQEKMKVTDEYKAKFGAEVSADEIPFE